MENSQIITLGRNYKIRRDTRGFMILTVIIMPKKSTTKLLSELISQSTRFYTHIIGTKIDHITIIKLISERG